MWRVLLITLCSLFDQQLLKTYCWPGAIQHWRQKSEKKTVFLLSRSWTWRSRCELRLKTDGKFRLLAEDWRQGVQTGREIAA